jgi:hypothetical protein
MTRLLVSVRTAAEAHAALEGGAAVIDVKEPANGPLGKAEDAVIGEVIRVVAGRVPVSAAMGELSASGVPQLGRGLDFCKWGLAGLASSDWKGALRQVATRLEATPQSPRLVTVAYADWRFAEAPPMEEICSFARQRPGSLLLIDTFAKAAGRSLLTLLTPAKIRQLCRLCRDDGVRVALAGSLGLPEIQLLCDAGADWFAVRGAACESCRSSAVSSEKVRQLADATAAAATSATPGS